MEDIFSNDLSKEIFESTYCYKGETIKETWERIATALSESEDEVIKETVKQANLVALSDFKLMLGGRIISNAGTEYSGTTLMNCFVSGFETPNADSMESIMAELRRQALILKSEGGYGCNFSVIRPRGSFIKGIGSSSPGAVKMMEMWDTQSRVITEGSGKATKEGKKKIRKGAMMGVLNIWHPDIEEYIVAKQTPGRLTKFNLSVGVTDAFMQAVKEDADWDLIFPDIHADEDKYRHEWNGDINTWLDSGGEIEVYKRVKARKLYDLITKSTYNRNEPGILFLDTINKMNNLNGLEYISATNPCGEEPLPPNGACLLAALNATQYILPDFSGWDFNKLGQSVRYAVRMMDNVVDITGMPLSQQVDEILNKRRIGLGVMGLGSALMMMRLRYGSEAALELIEQWFKFVANEAYLTSSKLAKEKEVFPAWDLERFLENGFSKNLEPETIDHIKKHGLRNSHLLTVAPTGNTSLFANIVSGGLEPVFLPEYVRTSGVDVLPDGLIPEDAKINSNWISTNWDKTKEGDVVVYTKLHEETLYKYDADRGFTKESLIRDYGVQNLMDRGIWDPEADWAATTNELDVYAHLNTMKVIAPYIDSSMSKTVNLPNKYPFKDFQNLYMEAWKTGTIKGITTYRDGTMTAVLKSVEDKSEELSASDEEYRRPPVVPADVHHINYKGEKYAVLVGMEKDKPIELFVLSAERGITIGKDVSSGELVKMKNGEYKLDTEFVTVKKLISHLTDEESTLTRLLSVGFLRHGRLEEAVKQLDKSPGSIASLAHVLKRVISLYIEKRKGGKCECGGDIVFQEGCSICLKCGVSKCG